MKEIPELIVSTPYAYEATLVGAGLALAGLTYTAMKLVRPWWEARAMRMDREKTINSQMAHHLWWTVKHMVKDGVITAKEGEMYILRFANLVPMRELLPDGVKTIKEGLEEKHPEQEVQQPVIEEPKVVSMLSAMSARLKAKTA